MKSGDWLLTTISTMMACSLVAMVLECHLKDEIRDVCGKCAPAECTETQGFGMAEAGDLVETNHFATIEKQQSICAEFSGDAYVIGGRSVLCVFGDLEIRGGKLDAVRARCEARGGRFSVDKNGPKCDLSWAK